MKFLERELIEVCRPEFYNDNILRMWVEPDRNGKKNSLRVFLMKRIDEENYYHASVWLTDFTDFKGRDCIGKGKNLDEAEQNLKEKIKQNIFVHTSRIRECAEFLNRSLL